MSRTKTATRETITCPVCKEQFTARTSRRRKHCSRKCSDVATASRYAAKRKSAVCILCGKSFTHRPGISPKCCGIVCSNTVKARKYAQAHADTLRGIPTGKGNSYTKEGGKHQHRAVMERHIGRVLRSDEVVHHIDGNIHNNEILNLKIVSRAAHLDYHVRGRAIESGCMI